MNEDDERLRNRIAAARAKPDIRRDGRPREEETIPPSTSSSFSFQRLTTHNNIIVIVPVEGPNNPLWVSWRR